MTESVLRLWLHCACLLYVVLLVFNAVGLVVWLPPCLINHMFGTECMGCGLNRAAVAVLCGEFKTAFDYNPLVFPLIGGAIVLFTRAYLDRFKILIR